MAKTKYLVRHNGEIIGTRSSDRTYTHAIACWGHGKSGAVATWCGRLDLAQGEQRKYQRMGFTAEILPVEIVPAKPARKPVIEDPDRRALFQPDFHRIRLWVSPNMYSEMPCETEAQARELIVQSGIAQGLKVEA